MMDVYVTNLGKYNEGELVGEWLTLPASEEKIQETMEAIGINEEYEEYFITDYESEFDIQIGEYTNIYKLNELFEEVEALDIWEQSKLKAIMEVSTSDLREALESLDSYEFYEGVTLRDYAEEIIYECYSLPEFALRYFDFDRFARDLSFDGYTETENGVLYSC